MPTDKTWEHAIDALMQSSAGPFVIGLLAVLIVLVVGVTYVLVSDQPHKRDVRQKELEIQAQREQRKADEARMRNEEAVRNAELRAQEIASNERMAQALEGQTVQMAALAARFDESADRSKGMGETVEETHDTVTDTNEKVTAIMPKIDEVHEFLLRSRD